MNESFKKLLKIGGIILVALVLMIILVGALSFGKTSTRSVVTRQSALNFSDSAVSSGMGVGSYPSPGVAPVAPPMGAPEMMKLVGEENSFGEVAYDNAQSAGPATTDKKVIKTGYLTMTVSTADEAVDKIGEIARAHGGEVFSSNFSQFTKNVKSGTVTVKVPMKEFDATFSELKKVGTQVVSESTNGQDVTAEYTDLQAQLLNKQREEAAVAKILEQSGKIDDVLAVTRELSRVRGEIERLQGRIRYMDSQTDMSTITIGLTEDVEIVPVSEGWRPYQVFKASVKQLIKNSQYFVDGLIQFMIVQIPALLIILVVFWVIYKLVRLMVGKYTKVG